MLNEPHYHRWDDGTFYSHEHRRGTIRHGHHGSRWGLTRQQILTLPIDERRKLMEHQVNEYLANISDVEHLKELHNLD